MDTGGRWTLLDDRGRIGGRVNVIDALAVLLAAAVAMAGIALAGGGVAAAAATGATAFAVLIGLAHVGAPRTETTTAVLDAGSLPTATVRQLDSLSMQGVRVRSTAVTPASDRSTSDSESPSMGVAVHPDRARTLLAIEIEHPPEATPSVDGVGLRPGTEFELNDDSPGRNAVGIPVTVREIGSEATRGRERRELVLDTTVPAEVGVAVEAGDEWTLADRSIATIEQVERFRIARRDRLRLRIGLTVEALKLDGNVVFAETPILLGARVPFRGETYALSGKIVHTGTTTEGTPTTRTATLVCRDADAGVAGAITPGDHDRVGKDVTARVLAVDRDANPSGCDATDDGTDDQIDDTTETPSRDDLRLTAELSIRETESGPQFKGEPIEIGSRLPLSLPDCTIRPQVVGFIEEDRPEAGRREGVTT